MPSSRGIAREVVVAQRVDVPDVRFPPDRLEHRAREHLRPEDGAHLLATNLPRKYTSDPKYVLGETEPGVDLLAVVASAGPGGEAAVTDALVRLLGNFGTHTRAFVRALPEPPR